jgi:transposase
MRHEVLSGVERRRRWSDEQKLRILAEVGLDGASVSAVARRHDIGRRQIYAWRRAMRRKGLVMAERPVFLPVSLAEAPVADTADAARSGPGGAHCVDIRLTNGRSLGVTADVPDAVLQRLIRAVEAA